jgi:hypothetical protein
MGKERMVRTLSSIRLVEGYRSSTQRKIVKNVGALQLDMKERVVGRKDLQLAETRRLDGGSKEHRNHYKANLYSLKRRTIILVGGVD